MDDTTFEVEIRATVNRKAFIQAENANEAEQIARKQMLDYGNVEIDPQEFSIEEVRVSISENEDFSKFKKAVREYCLSHDRDAYYAEMFLQELEDKEPFTVSKVFPCQAVHSFEMRIGKSEPLAEHPLMKKKGWLIQHRSTRKPELYARRDEGLEFWLMEDMTFAVTQYQELYSFKPGYEMTARYRELTDEDYYGTDVEFLTEEFLDNLFERFSI